LDLSSEAIGASNESSSEQDMFSHCCDVDLNEIVLLGPKQGRDIRANDPRTKANIELKLT
jgi:hypothetical protein